MEEIVKRLSEIEVAAALVIDNAQVEKEELKAEFHKKRQKLDEKIRQQTALEVEKLREQLEEVKEREIHKLQEQVKEHLDALEKEFEKNRQAYSQKAFQKIIEVR